MPEPHDPAELAQPESASMDEEAIPDVLPGCYAAPWEEYLAQRSSLHGSESDAGSPPVSIYSGGIHADCVIADGEDEDPFGYVTEMVASWNHLMHTYKSGLLTAPPRDFAHSLSTDPDGVTTLL
eukprot:8276279-Prorocentrum_lima.AAC.1